MVFVFSCQCSYDTKLKQEEETGIELMAQHALMKKNLQMLSKDSNQQKEDIRRLKDKETRLFETIHTLEKDIQSHKKEIRCVYLPLLSNQSLSAVVFYHRS